MMMFETSKHVPKTEKRCCVLKIKSSLANYLVKFSESHKLHFLYMYLILLDKCFQYCPKEVGNFPTKE